MRPLAVIGHVAQDVVDGGQPRIGGGPWYAGRALRALGRPAQLGVKCGADDRRAFLSRLAPLGLPVALVTGKVSTAFAIDYDGERRRMSVEAIGEPWTPEEALAAVGRAEWVHAAPLLRSDFPLETLRALGRSRRVLLDGQGLVRRPERGPLVLEADFDPELLDAVAILKLAQEEADVLPPLHELRVPEILLTRGSAGVLVRTRGREEHVPTRAVAGVVDPTGAGDAFAVAYLAARSDGHAPASAARRAAALVAGLLAGRTL